MNIKHFEFLALQVTALKQSIPTPVFEEAYQAVEDGKQALKEYMDNQNDKLAKSTTDSAVHVGKVVEWILSHICKELSVEKRDKEGVSAQCGKINKKRSNTIQKNILYIMNALYEYRNKAAHSSDDKKAEISFDELLMLLQSLLVLLEWYARCILKEISFNFREVIQKSNLEKYQLAYKMAIADGTIQTRERKYLNQIADDFSIPREITIEIEKEIAHINPKNPVHCEQTIYFDNIYPAINAVEKIIVEEYKSKGVVECLNIALDMEVTWPFISEHFQNNEIVKNMTYAGLIINPDLESPLLSSKWRNNIKHQLENYQDFLEENKSLFSSRNFKFGIKINNKLPFIHGILVNRKHLLWSFLDVNKNDCVQSQGKFYHRNTTEDPLGKYYVKIFLDWFNIFWENGSPVEISKKYDFILKKLPHPIL